MVTINVGARESKKSAFLIFVGVLNQGKIIVTERIACSRRARKIVPERFRLRNEGISTKTMTHAYHRDGLSNNFDFC